MGQTVGLDQTQQCTDAWQVHFDTDEIALRPSEGGRRQRVTHAKANFERARRAAAKGEREVNRLRAVINAKGRLQVVAGARLGVR